jgi:ABC-2 type transport system permease protein
MAFGLLLGLAITLGGQYLLQGVSEEKDSRILEALLCATRPEELLAGKLIGLGGAGLLLVALWAAFALPFAVAAATVVTFELPPFLVVFAIVYFLLGYLFYASLMIGIGGMTNNMREAQQFSVWFSFLNFMPFVLLVFIIGNPNGALPTALSLFPPTAATTMMLRMASPSASVPAWQIALSLLLLAGAAVAALIASARVFRIGMLLYGKAPTLPEIVRWARRG